MKTFGLLLSLCTATVRSADYLFEHATIISFDEVSVAVKVLHDSSLLILDDRIDAIFPSNSTSVSIPSHVEKIDASGKIITPGFVDTHHHVWQSAYRTISQNITLPVYVMSLSPLNAGSYFSDEDIYYSELIGLWESLESGVTSVVDHAHGSMTRGKTDAAINASIDSGARVWHGYGFNMEPEEVTDQLAHYDRLTRSSRINESLVSLGVAWDYWTQNSNETNQQVVKLVRESNPAFFTTHYLGGAWGSDNNPNLLHSYGILNTSVPVIFSHATALSADEATLLRSTDQYISNTPESEMHFGHGRPYAHLIQDQTSLGIDTHWTFSGDILTQARIWLQSVRLKLFEQVLDDFQVPLTNGMSVEQAFLLATRNGGLALRRPDIGVLVPGAKADIVVFSTDAMHLLGWSDAVAAIMLHANTGDMEHVLVNGEFRKRDFKLVFPDSVNATEARQQFVTRALRIKKEMAQIQTIDIGPSYIFGGAQFGNPHRADVVHGSGDGYEQSPTSQQFLHEIQS